MEETGNETTNASNIFSGNVPWLMISFNTFAHKVTRVLCWKKWCHWLRHKSAIQGMKIRGSCSTPSSRSKIGLKAGKHVSQHPNAYFHHQMPSVSGFYIGIAKKTDLSRRPQPN